MNELSLPVNNLNTVLSEPGLYLFLPDNTIFELTKKNIDKVTKEYWEDESKIPQKVKDAIAFQRCSICPQRNENGICNSLKPILPILERVDKFKSYDKIMAIYKSPDKKMFSFNETDMQGGLLFVTVFSLINYCLFGQKYSSYYRGINPLETMPEFASNIFLNIYYEKKGNKNEVEKTINNMSEEISLIVNNLLARLRLICSSDPVLNAFVGAQIVVEYLNMENEKILNTTENSFTNFTDKVACSG